MAAKTQMKMNECHVRCYIYCIIFLIVFLFGLYFVLPKYELMSPTARFNKVTGKVESYVQVVSPDGEGAGSSFRPR